VIDFSGWWDNWEWSGTIYTDVPSRLKSATAMLGAVGMIGVIGSWIRLGVLPPLWALGLVAAGLAIDVASQVVADEWQLLIVSYGTSALAAGALALLALWIPAPDVRASFASIAPCLVVAGGPITTRAIGATVYAHSMIDFVIQREKQVAAALAGETEHLVARIERVHGNAVELLTLGEHQRPLRTTWSALKRSHKLDANDHLLIESAEIGDPEVDGYRNTEQARRLMACASSRYLGRSTQTMPANRYWDEVRAGIVLLVLWHAAIGIIAVVLA
jgi:hypothetical protein